MSLKFCCLEYLVNHGYKNIHLVGEVVSTTDSNWGPDDDYYPIAAEKAGKNYSLTLAHTFNVRNKSAISHYLNDLKNCIELANGVNQKLDSKKFYRIYEEKKRLEQAIWQETPSCPKCKVILVVRKNHRTKKPFWGCKYFFQCGFKGEEISLEYLKLQRELTKLFIANKNFDPEI